MDLLVTGSMEIMHDLGDVGPALFAYGYIFQKHNGFTKFDRFVAFAEKNLTTCRIFANRLHVQAFYPQTGLR